MKSTVSTTPVPVRRTRIVGGGVVVLDQPVQTAAACTTGGLETAGSQIVAARRAAAASRRFTSRCEVASDIEDHLRCGPWDRDIGDRERTRATESHSDSVGPIVTNREVESRAGWVVRCVRAYVQIAQRRLLSHGQVACDCHSVGGNATTIGDLEGPGHIRAECTRQPRAIAGVQDARRSEGMVGGWGHRRLQLGRDGLGEITAVSYTHLTLPTNREV